MDKNQVKADIELLNSMNVVDADGDGESIFYVLVEDNSTNREIIAKLIGFADIYISGDGKTDTDGYDGDLINIVPLAFAIGAEYFDGDKFI